jgi:hypothetical protein
MWADRAKANVSSHWQLVSSSGAEGADGKPMKLFALSGLQRGQIIEISII